MLSVVGHGLQNSHKVYMVDFGGNSSSPTPGYGIALYTTVFLHQQCKMEVTIIPKTQGCSALREPSVRAADARVQAFPLTQPHFPDADTAPARLNPLCFLTRKLPTWCCRTACSHVRGPGTPDGEFLLHQSASQRNLIYRSSLNWVPSRNDHPC